MAEVDVPTLPQAPLARGAVRGRYVVDELLGAGAMGQVYAAFDPELERRVALKLLHPNVRATEKGRSRLLREAQAMARLSHPGVISVYDVGTIGEELFIAMELVDGVTLTDWLAARPQATWRELLPLFLQAGRGLAAAHAAGLVHRDFKPDNVLVGSDGRVRVTDFGIAQCGRADDSGELELNHLLAAEQLTRTGAVVGTPAYMAPEQLDGEICDGRGDQFSFCVALFEALHGRLPFRGQSAHALRVSMATGAFNDVPPTRLPARLKKALLRGLAEAPARRHPSMEALLDALERSASGASPSVLLALAAGLAFAVMGMVMALSPSEPTACAGSEAHLHGVWDEPRRTSVRSAFLATGLPFAEASLAAVERQLDEYAQRWVSTHAEICEATRVRHEQPEEVMARRMQCLFRRQQELEALAAIFVKADPGVVERAASASAALAPLADCSELLALSRRSAPPPEAVAPAVSRVRAGLARVKALRLSGKWAEGLALAKSLVTEAEAIDHLPVRIEAMLLRGSLEQRLEAGTEIKSEATLREAAVLAYSAGIDELAAEAWVMLVYVAAQNLRDSALAHRYAEFAQAAIARLGGDLELEGRLATHLTIVHIFEGNYPKAVEHSSRAIALREKKLSSTALGLLPALFAATALHLDLGDMKTALALSERQLAIVTGMVGPEHPALADALISLAQAQLGLGDHARALENVRRARAIKERVQGSRHIGVATSLHEEARVLLAMGRADEALEPAQRAAAIFSGLGPGNPYRSSGYEIVAEVLLEQGQLREAARLAREAVAADLKTLGAEHTSTLVHQGLVARVLLRRGEARGALKLLGNVTPKAEKIVKNPVWLAAMLAAQGEAALTSRRPDAAVTHLRAALALYERGHPSPRQLGTAKAQLARALWATRRQAEAMALAQSAERQLNEAGLAGARELKALKAWQAGLRRAELTAAR